MEALRTPNEELVCRVRLTASHPFMFVGAVHVHNDKLDSWSPRRQGAPLVLG